MGSDSEEKKMVLRLKEILPDRSEQEICEMLKECGMDPDEAVQRLLSQGRVVAFLSLLCFCFRFLSLFMVGDESKEAIFTPRR